VAYFVAIWLPKFRLKTNDLQTRTQAMVQLFSVKLPSVGQMWRTGIQPKRQPEMHHLVCIFDVVGSPRIADSQLLRPLER
jgi:hypothetical protein